MNRETDSQRRARVAKAEWLAKIEEQSAAGIHRRRKPKHRKKTPKHLRGLLPVPPKPKKPPRITVVSGGLPGSKR